VAKEILRLGGILCIITLIVTLMLSGVNLLTKDIIAQNTMRAENEARAEIIPADSFEDMGDGIYAAKKGADTVGYCVSVESSGFGGAINMIVGINTDKTVAGIRIISHAETAGLGAKAAEPAFTDGFVGGQLPLTVTKSTPENSSQISAISGATITSNAVVNGVNSALEILEEKGVI